MIDRLAEILVDIAYPFQEARGEAGMHQYAKGLHGLAFSGIGFVKSWLRETADEEGTSTPRFRVDIAPGRRMQGQYVPREGRIRCQPHLRLDVLIHEMAHHVVREQYGSGIQPHGRIFKKVLRMLFNRTYARLGRRVPTFYAPCYSVCHAPALQLRPKVGTRVRVRRPRAADIVGTVLRYGPRKAKVRSEADGRTWNVPVAMMEALD